MIGPMQSTDVKIVWERIYGDSSDANRLWQHMRKCSFQFDGKVQFYIELQFSKTDIV